jgi:heme exporter protein C
MMLQKYWWKIICAILLLYTVVMGFLLPIPYLPKLKESVRNLFYHVPMWYIMLISFLISVIYSILYLRSNQIKHDSYSNQFVITGLGFGVLGIITGMEWANIQWGAPWNNDPKQVGAALTLLIYAAYLVLRNSVKDQDKQASLASVYNIFSFAIIIPLIYIIPTHFASLHPGSDNKPFEALKTQDNLLKWVSIPAFFAWILFGIWITDIRIRMKKISDPHLF